MKTDICRANHRDHAVPLDALVRQQSRMVTAKRTNICINRGGRERDLDEAVDHGVAFATV